MAAGRLLQILGFGFGLAATVGAVIGAGILRAPSEVAAQLPNPALIVGIWVAGGLYALLGALSMAEVATMVARSGGHYPIAHRAFGEYAAFVVGWADFIVSSGSIAVFAILVGDNVGVLSASLGGHPTSVAAVTVLVLAAGQWQGLRSGSRTQVITSVLKSVGLLALVGACFVMTADPAPAAASTAPLAALPGLPDGRALLIAGAIALQGVIYTYDGWYCVIYFAEEIREPGRDIPRSLFVSVLVVTVIYVLVNVAFLHVLPLASLAAAKAPAAEVAGRLFGHSGELLIAGLLVLSLLGAINAVLLGTPRILFAMGRDGLVWRRAAAVNAGGTPTVALLLTTAVALVFLMSGTFEQVIGSLSVLLLAIYAAFYLAVFALRRSEPDAPRPYRTWGYPYTTALGLGASLVFLAATAAGAPRSAILSVVLLAASYPAFRLQRRFLGQTPG